jgi:hypothetical protein
MTSGKLRYINAKANLDKANIKYVISKCKRDLEQLIIIHRGGHGILYHPWFLKWSVVDYNCGGQMFVSCKSDAGFIRLLTSQPLPLPDTYQEMQKQLRQSKCLAYYSNSYTDQLVEVVYDSAWKYLSVVPCSTATKAVESNYNRSNVKGADFHNTLQEAHKHLIELVTTP